jgi:hypothetical protein
MEIDVNVSDMLISPAANNKRALIYKQHEMAHPSRDHSLGLNINGHLCIAAMTDLSIVHPSKTPDQIDEH